MTQLAQLNGMNLFGVDMNMLGTANLSAMGITPEAQLLAAQIATSGGGLGQPGLGVGAGLGSFGGLEGGICGDGLRGGSGRSGGRSPGLGGKGGTAGNGGAKKDEVDFDPAVLNDVTGWLRTLRLHKYMPNFEGMTRKEIVVMDEQALEAQGVAALGKRRKILKTFEVVRRNMSIDDPTAPPPPPPPPPCGPAPVAPASTLGCSAGSGGGLSSA